MENEVNNLRQDRRTKVTEYILYTVQSFRDSIKLRQDRRIKVTEYILYRASGKASSSERTGG